jgi:anti-sigma B factor antagonist
MAIVLRPHGKLDLKEAVKLKKKMHAVAQTAELENHQVWIVDLAQVNDIDHFGAIALLEVRRYAQYTGHQLFLNNVNHTVLSVLNIAQLTQEFDFLGHHNCKTDVSSHCCSGQTQTQTVQKLTQLSTSPSPHSRRFSPTLTMLRSKFVERSTDVPISI